jgi:predicted tellurium resistance membrane protein TerC
MEWLFDPTIWVGLLTLVVLEIVLGIDNLIFIAILAENCRRTSATRRVLGLTLALVMRLGLLSLISWLVTLTTPLFSIWTFSFSGRDLILLVGGLFLLFKATTELHERLEGVTHAQTGPKVYAGFGLVVAQIVVLDAVFSLDAVITAVGMVDNLYGDDGRRRHFHRRHDAGLEVLTRFVNAHPTVVVLCLSFLLMIGLSLVAEGLGFHIPKGYLYAAIGFSIVIEFFNQLARRNFLKLQSNAPLRDRTAQAVLSLLGGRKAAKAAEEHEVKELPDVSAFGVEERNMVSGVLTLAERSIRSVMTPRGDVSWVNLNDSSEKMLPCCAKRRTA